MKIILFFLASLSVLWISSCKTTDKKPKYIPQIPNLPGTKVLVLCEGNFQWNNADFDLYMPDSQLIYNQVFSKYNGGNSAGDVLQSGFANDSFIYLVLNNSGKISVINKYTYTLHHEIKGFTSPRYACWVDNKLFATDLYANKVFWADASAKSVQGSVAVKGWTEQIISTANGLAVVSNNGWLYWLNSSIPSKIDSTPIHKNASAMCMDKNKKLWVMAADSGKIFLSKVNISSRKVELNMEMAAKQGASKMAISKNADSLFFIAGDLFTMSCESNQMPQSPFYKESGVGFYGLGVDPWSGQVYLANAKDFVSKGQIIRLDGSGKVLHRFDTGINPGEFVFYR